MSVVTQNRMSAGTLSPRDPSDCCPIQGEADKVEVLRQVLREAPPDAWLLWADFDTVCK